MSPCLTLYDKVVWRYKPKCVKNCPKIEVLLDISEKMVKVMCKSQIFAILEVSNGYLKIFYLVFNPLDCHLHHHSYMCAKFQVKMYNFWGGQSYAPGHITLTAAKISPSRRNFWKILSTPPGGMLVLTIQQVSEQNIKWSKLCDFSIFGI